MCKIEKNKLFLQIGWCDGQEATLQRASLQVHQALQLLECQENEDRRGLKTRPCRKPAFEHKHRALLRERCSDYAECRAGSRSARVHDAALQDISW